MSNTFPSLLLIPLLVVAAPSAHGADENRCAASLIRVAKVHAACQLRAEKAAAKQGGEPDATACDEKLSRRFAIAEAHCAELDHPLDDVAIGDTISLVASAIGRAARGGGALDLQAFCGAGTTWDHGTRACEQDVAVSETLAAGLSTHFLPQEVDGVLIERRYQIHAPATLDPGRTYPVVFAFHGNGGSGDAFAARLAAFVSAGDFIGVYPDGVAQSWNLGREASNADDVEFVEAIAAEVSAYGEVDPDKLFALGLSNGAALVHRLAIRTDLFRGIATVVTPLLAAEQPASGSKAVRVLQILGTADHLIPYGGGAGVLGHEFLAAEESAALWASASSCATPPVEETTAHGNIRIEYDGCADDARVVHYGVVGAGHGIPPGTEGGLDALITRFFLEAA